MEIIAVNKVTQNILDGINTLLPQLSGSASTLTETELQEIVSSECCTLIVAVENDTVLGGLTLVVFRIPTGIRAWIEDEDTTGKISHLCDGPSGRVALPPFRLGIVDIPVGSDIEHLADAIPADQFGHSPPATGPIGILFPEQSFPNEMLNGICGDMNWFFGRWLGR